MFDPSPEQADRRYKAISMEPDSYMQWDTGPYYWSAVLRLLYKIGFDRGRFDHRVVNFHSLDKRAQKEILDKEHEFAKEKNRIWEKLPDFKRAMSNRAKRIKGG